MPRVSSGTHQGWPTGTYVEGFEQAKNKFLEITDLCIPSGTLSLYC